MPDEAPRTERVFIGVNPCPRCLANGRYILLNTNFIKAAKPSVWCDQCGGKWLAATIELEVIE
jgi:hypothetical protein